MAATRVSPVHAAAVTTLTTPAGQNLFDDLAQYARPKRLCSDGFTTMALPEMIAGAMRDAAKADRVIERNDATDHA
jgi:hypothetical protein